MSEIPEGLYYNEEHDWVRLEGDIGTLGITDYAQGELGDIVFLELPSVGDTVERGGIYGTVEAVKTVADLISPVTGEVVEVNEALEDDAAVVNGEPYGGGWMVKVRLEDPAEVESLLDADSYRSHLAE